MAWNTFVDEILNNTDNGQRRSVEPIKDEDKNNIEPLEATDALLLWERCFPEDVKYALMFEYSYGEPKEISLFDESEIDPASRSAILDFEHAPDTPILIYWNRRTAVKTNWGMLIKYWDNFFYYPENAVIYAEPDHYYFYDEMILKKWRDQKGVDEEGAFDCFSKLKDGEAKRAYLSETLLKDFSCELQNELYELFLTISDGFRAMKGEDIRKEYMRFCLAEAWAYTQKILLACKPYSKSSLQCFKQELREGGENILQKTLSEQFSAILKKLLEAHE